MPRNSSYIYDFLAGLLAGQMRGIKRTAYEYNKSIGNANKPHTASDKEVAYGRSIHGI